MTGGVSVGDDTEEPPADWVTPKMWGEINRASSGLPGMKGFVQHFKTDLLAY